MIAGTLEIQLMANIARLQRDMDDARRVVGGAMDNISRMATLAKNAIAGIAGGLSLAALGRQVVEAQREFDKLNASLITATGSAANAAQAYKALQSFAATTPYRVQEATEAFIKMRNLGLDPSERALRSYGNTAASMGKGLNQMVEAVADAATGEFERLKEFGITAKQNGDRVALTFKGMTANIGNNAKEIQDYLRKLGQNDFAGAMEARASTLDGMISNLADSWDSAMLRISKNGIGDAAASTVSGVSAALTDLGIILDVVGGKAKGEGQAVKEATGVHVLLTTVFETLAVLGTNVAFVFNAIGGDIGAFAAQVKMLFEGGMKGLLDGSTKRMVQDIGRERVAEAERERQAVDEKSAAILAAADKAREAQEKEAATRSKNGADQLAQYAVVLTAEQKQQKALADTLEIRNRLNGVNAQTAGELAKLKAAVDAGAISQADYNRYVAQINKDATQNSTAYKNAIKLIDLQTEALRRQAAARAFDNQQLQLQLGFLNRTGQLNDEDFINQSADVDLKALREKIDLLKQQEALEAKKLDSRAKVKELKSQIEQAEKEIDARELKRKNDLFEQEQKRYRESANNYADLLEAAQAETKSVQDQARDQQDYINQLGMTGMQIADVTAKRLLDKAALIEQVAAIRDVQDASGRLGDESRKQAEELRKLAAGTISAERLKEQQQFWGDVERVAHDTFVSIADGGKDAFTRLKESAKNIFFEWLYQMTLKKWVINIGASTDGAGAVAALQGGSSLLTQGGSLLGTASNLYSALTGGMTLSGGVGTGFMGSLAGGLNGAGAGAPLASATGLQIGNAIADVVGPEIAGALSTGLGAVATALPWIGGAVALYSLGKAAFGHGPREYTSSTLNGSLGVGGFSGGIDNAWKEKGGWFSSDRTGVEHQNVDMALATGLATTYQAMKDASTAYAKVLGLNADSIANRTQAISIALGKDEAANQKAIVDFFAGVGDQIAKELAPDLDRFTKSGESLSQTLQRLATDMQGTNQVAQLLGTSGDQLFGSSDMQSMAARERLVDAAGGLQALAQQAQAFGQNFLTEAERMAPVAAALDKALASLGLDTIPTTRDEFKGLVQDMIASGAAATDDGAKRMAQLLALNEVFAQVYPDDAAEKAQKAAAILQERQGLQEQLDQMTMSSNQLLGKQRDALDESNRALFDQIQAMQAAQQVAIERKELQDQLDELTLSSTEKLQRQRDALDESNRALFDQIQAVNAQAEAEARVAEARAAAGDDNDHDGQHQRQYDDGTRDLARGGPADAVGDQLDHPVVGRPRRVRGHDRQHAVRCDHQRGEERQSIEPVAGPAHHDAGQPGGAQPGGSGNPDHDGAGAVEQFRQHVPHHAAAERRHRAGRASAGELKRHDQAQPAYRGQFDRGAGVERQFRPDPEQARGRDGADRRRRPDRGDRRAARRQ